MKRKRRSLLGKINGLELILLHEEKMKKKERKKAAQEKMRNMKDN